MTTQTTDKATARPWRVGTNGKSFCYFEPSYSTTVPIQIGYCEALSRFNQDQKANAALIVKAVNEHAALVAVAEAAKAFLKPFIDMDDDAGSNMNLLEDALSNLAAIRAGKPVTGSEALMKPIQSETLLTGLEDCGLHKRTPYGITNVSMTQFSVARFSGTISYNGNLYVYFPDADILVRDDVLKWKKKQEKQSKP